MEQTQIVEGNKLIAAFIGVEPEIEYYVGHEAKETICYIPKNCYFNTSAGQKAECERWLKEQATKYPNGWVTKDGYTTIRSENYPRYERDWNMLMPVVEKIRHRYNVIAFEVCFSLGVIVKVGMNRKWHTYESNEAIEAVWYAVVDAVKMLNSLDAAHGSVATKLNSSNAADNQ